MQTVQEKICAAGQEYELPAKKPIYSFFKRFFDIVLCSIALIVLSPLFLVVAILIKREDGGPVFSARPA